MSSFQMLRVALAYPAGATIFSAVFAVFAVLAVLAGIAWVTARTGRGIQVAAGETQNEWQ